MHNTYVHADTRSLSMARKLELLSNITICTLLVHVSLSSLDTNIPNKNERGNNLQQLFGKSI